MVKATRCPLGAGALGFRRSPGRFVREARAEPGQRGPPPERRVAGRVRMVGSSVDWMEGRRSSVSTASHTGPDHRSAAVSSAERSVGRSC